MTSRINISTTEPGAIEEWFLQSLSAEPLPVDILLQAAKDLQQSIHKTLAASLSELLLDELVKRKLVNETVSLLEVMASPENDSEALVPIARAAVSEALRDNTNGKTFVASSGFDSGVPLLTCLSRIRMLLSLKPGLFCYDKTWGFGIVKDVSSFSSRLLVDFTNKRGHEMSLAYAAETLSLVKPDHILALRHSSPEQLGVMVDGQPGEVVRMALKSFGPLNAVRLQEVLCDGIVKPGQWKDFWARARDMLKQDPEINFPSRRSDPISFRSAGATDQRDNGLSQLTSERTPQRIVQLLEAIARDGKSLAGNDVATGVIRDRLTFVCDATRNAAPDLFARAFIAANAIAGTMPTLNTTSIEESLLAPGTLAAVSERLPARYMEPLLEALWAGNKALCAESVLSCLSSLSITMLSEALPFLAERQLEDSCANAIKRAMSEHALSPEVLLWLARNIPLMQKWRIMNPWDLPVLLLAVLETPPRGAHAKTLALLTALFDTRAWLADALSGSDPQTRHDLIQRVRSVGSWPEANRNSAVAHIVKLFPDAMSALALPVEKDNGSPAGLFTSWRTHVEHIRQLEKVIYVDIPKNGRDLAHARSYGDLSENQEFKAAKEQQSILSNLRDKLETDLRRVKGTLFAGFPTDKAGMGTQVQIRMNDGSERYFYILGEWDSDEPLGIISSASGMATALTGHVPGDIVTIPGQSGATTCTVIHVGPLPDPILKWAQADSAKPAADTH